MNVKLLLINCILFYFLLSISNADQPLSVCSENFPFRLTENKCANFSEICFKQGDDQCNQLQNACKQCPPEKITMMKMTEISKRIDQISEKFLKLFLASLLLNIVIILVLLLENRFKLITKICQSVQGKDTKYQMLSSRKRVWMNSNYLTTAKPEHGSHLVDPNRIFKFQIIPEQKEIELKIYGNDNIVRIKKVICQRWSKAEPDFYKIMQLKYKETILDDNDYLLSCVPSCDETIKCIIDYSTIAEDIVVLHVEGIIQRYTELIQMSIYDTIDKLKNIIGKINNNQDILLYHKLTKSNKYEELNINTTVEQCKLNDNGHVKVVTKCKGRILICSIFDDKTPFQIAFINTERVSSIVDKVKYELKSDNLILIFNNQCLTADQFIFHYNIDQDAQIKYCLFYDTVFITTDNKNDTDNKTRCSIILKEKIGKGELFDVHKAFDKYSNKEIAVKLHNISKINPEIYSPPLKKELTKFAITKSHSRFVQLFGVYMNKLEIYLSMELMIGGSLENHLKTCSKDLNNTLTLKWSKQILEALDCLHDHGIVQQYLTTSNILLDGNGDLKLSSFNLIENIKFNDKIIRFRAPEILNKKPFSIKVDVWSFGVILVKIITGKSFNPYSKVKSDADKTIYKKDENIDYKFPDETFDEFKQIVDNCLMDNPINRTNVKQLLANNIYRSK